MVLWCQNDQCGSERCVLHKYGSRIPAESAINTVLSALHVAPQLAPLPATPIDPGSVRLVRIDADWLASNTRVLYVSYRRETSPSAVADSVYNLTEYNGAVSAASSLVPCRTVPYRTVLYHTIPYRTHRTDRTVLYRASPQPIDATDQHVGSKKSGVLDTDAVLEAMPAAGRAARAPPARHTCRLRPTA